MENAAIVAQTFMNINSPRHRGQALSMVTHRAATGAL
ncbi:hypothetical protein HD601_005691 [Jiangella mangrovi]|uniref:Uncharacterized protein n=1 Tax=Jiangella mangrovi TaxID=1524084 RepID=A0A7W9GWK7_9ACTN|nr:hypothetical protein [Jiangella mangrovi]